MRRAGRIELVLAIACAGLVLLAGEALPGRVGVGRLVLTASALLLAQSLVRDLWLVWRARGIPGGGPGKAARCMCVESTVGAAGIVIGVALLVSGLTTPVPMSPWSWSALVLLTLLLGFTSKDFVLTWPPLRLRRDPDHMNIVFKWKA